MLRRTALAGLLVLLVSPLRGQTALGTAFTYQGRLTDGGGPASGIYDLQFTLFSAASGGTQLGSVITSDNVTVTDGLFTVALDFGAGAFTGSARWLEIAVQPGAGGGFTTLAPRQELTATPNALYSRAAGSAGTLSGLVGVANGGTGANLGATGGPGQYVKQSNPGAPLTVGAIPASDLSGVVGVAAGGTGANFGGTGGPGQLVRQPSAGGPLSVAPLGAADIPGHTHGAGDVVSGVLPLARGGTGQAAFAVNGAVYASGAGTLAATPAGATGQVLVATSGVPPSWSSTTGITSVGTLGSLSVSGTATVGALACTGCVQTAALQDGSGTSPKLNPTVFTAEAMTGSYSVDDTPANNVPVCPVGPYMPATSQRALLDAGIAWSALSSGPLSVAVVFSTNGGASWSSAFAVPFFDTNSPNGWGASSRSGALNLNAGTSYLFAVAGWGGNAFTVNETRCNLRVVVVGR
jgi:hypothetical protein